MNWRLLGTLAARVILARVILAGALIFALLADNVETRAQDGAAIQDWHGPVSKQMIERLPTMQAQPQVQARRAPTNNADAATMVDPWQALANFACVVEGYGPVPLISQADLPTLAVAARAPGSSTLEIYYNANWMNAFRLPTRLFWLQHECSHHRLGHTQSKTEKSLNCHARQEDAADCAAILTMANIERQTIDARGFRDVEFDLSQLPGGDGVHREGKDRIQLLRTCLSDSAQAAQMMDAGC